MLMKPCGPAGFGRRIPTYFRHESRTRPITGVDLLCQRTKGKVGLLRLVDLKWWYMKNDVLKITAKTEDRWKLHLDRRGEELCRVELVRERLRIGRALITTGGVAGLHTPHDRRMEGHARRLMEASHRFLREQGCSIALMNAIPGFYHRFGYDVVFPVYRLFVETDNLLQTRRQHGVRRALVNEQPALVRLYNQCNRYRTGTLVRPADWRFDRLVNYGRPPGTLLLVEDQRGRVTGYALCRPRGDRYFVQELNGRSHVAFESLANAIGTRARRAGFERVHFRMPLDHPFGVFCSRLGCAWEIQYHVNAEDMGRVLDVPRFLLELRSEWGFRLRNAMRTANVRLWFVTDTGEAGLQVERGRIRRSKRRHPDAHEVTIPQAALLQLVLGYRTVDDVAGSPNVRMPVSVKPVMDVLFPQTPATMPMIAI